ncbi:GNAT family N-acetyltransferase [Neisseria shayeganii]|uniref:Putative GCN5-related N-acetyltransferase n=1 Tax=Neisseria shayeganii 871 TaxID=1032488 RepID=G4CF82_9NEIS|nr:GNAT family N-acetyltransferase [Neisseria shayeganii]EGY53526.1 putative GCN5-related N-acetyltransferase [Neisseria shayeganii 871]
MTGLVYTAIDNEQDLMAAENQIREFFPIHQNFRPHFQTFDSYFEQMQRVIADRARLLLVRDAGGLPVGLALYRMHHNTYQHKLFFLEDLVVAENRRGEQIGAQILRYCEDLARQHGCRHVSLDSGTFRTRAHKFYYVHGYVADCFHFSKAV